MMGTLRKVGIGFGIFVAVIVGLVAVAMVIVSIEPDPEPAEEEVITAVRSVTELDDLKAERNAREQDILDMKNQKEALAQEINLMSLIPTYDCDDLDILVMQYMGALGILKMLDNTMAGNPPPEPPISRKDFAAFIVVDPPVTRQMAKDIDKGFYNHCGTDLANLDHLLEYVENEQAKVEG